MRALPSRLLPSSIWNLRWPSALSSTTACSLWLLVACVLSGNRAFAQGSGPSSVPTLAITRHALTNNGRIEGSCQQLTGEGVNLNSGAVFTGDFLLPGTPTVQVNGNPTWSGQQTGTGSTSPTGYTITVNSGVQMRYLVKRTDPVTLASVATPPSPTGTRQVTINSPSDASSVGNWTTVKDLTLNSGAGNVSVPAGTYGTFNASNSNNTGFVFGTAGATTASVYNLQALTLNSNSRLTVVGPVIINVAGQVLVNSNTAIVGSTSNSGWLQLNDAGAGVTLNSGSVIYGAVNAPAGTINVNGKIAGTAACNQLSVNSGGVITAAVVPNQAPIVNAGSTQTITLPASATLSGTVTDDGLPAGAAVTSTWSKSSGPGTVTFANAAAAQTSASFSAAGTYVLQLSASDTQLAGSATVTITVNAANKAPVVTAGNNQTISLPANASLAGSVSDDGLPTGAAVTSTWTKSSGPGTVTFANAAAAQTTASFSAAGTYVLQLSASDTQLTSSATVTITVNPANKAPVVTAGAAQTITLPASASLAGTVSDDGLPTGAAVTSAWSKSSGPGTVTFGNAAAPQTSASFSAAGTYVLQLSASDTQLSSSATVTITVNAANKAPVVNAGAAQTITLPANASLAGSVTDDGLPTGAKVTSTWTKVSGPGTVSFGNAAAPQTTASFSVAGTYVLQLSATDTQLSSNSTVTITVNPQNQPPTVAAGAAQTIRLPAAAALSGTATDDGLPSGSHLTTTWSQVSGPGTATFSAANATSTQASFSTAGTYVLRLSASDTQLTSTSDVTITVLPANQAPVVTAGAAQTVTLPANATLAGTVTDDGLPTGAAVTSTWNKVSGPGTVTFANPASAQTTASFDKDGTYVLQLSASDTQLAGNATVTITVKLSNQPPRVAAGAAQTITQPASATLTGSVTDDGLPQGATVKITWAKVSGPGNVTFANPSIAQTTASFDQPGVYVLSLTGDDTQFARVAQTTVTVHAANQPPQVNAGPAQSVEIGTLLTLNGTATDDGLPRGGGLAITWSQVNGPGTATFSAPFSAVTGVTFSAAGTYTLRLSANDSALTSTSDVQVTVTAKTNKAPIVHAGAPQTLHGTRAAMLAGMATDDGLPTGSTLTLAWSQVSGPGTASFGQPAAAQTSVTFSTAGTYVLQLSANDGALAGSDQTTIVVAGTQNQAPVVHAGNAQNVLLTQLVALSGTVVDDGLPTGAKVTSTWSQVSGPGPAAFQDPTNPATVVSFPAQGVYVLRLSATDTDLSAADQATITVNATSNNLRGGTLALTPVNSGPVVVTTAYTLHATLLDKNGHPLVGEPVAFTVTGPNATNGSAVTNASGVADFSYTGTQPGADQASANAGAGDNALTSNPATVSWVSPVQTVSTTPVLGRFYFCDGQGTFNTPPTQEPCFSQYFPTINFNPADGTVPGNTSGVGVTTHPFTDVTTDLNGNYTGTIVPSGNGFTAGLGPLFNFSAVFTGTFTVAKPGDITFYFFSDDGFVFGAGNGASYVSGNYENPPASGKTMLQGLTVVGSYNHPSSPSGSQMTVHFPTAGTYPYEIDYAEGFGGDLALTMTTSTPAGIRSIAPSGSLTLSPNAVPSQTPGQPVQFTVQAADASGTSLPGATVALNIVGPNGQQLTATTDAMGLATFSYAGTQPGSDNVQAQATLSGQLAVSNAVPVLWLPPAGTPNTAPVVVAGPDQTTTYPNFTVVSATVSDDGLPANHGLQMSWAQVSGPGGTSFSNGDFSSSAVNFSAPGDYVLRLTVSDGELSNFADVHVTVHASNQAPVVHAGAAQTVPPFATATLNGTATDDGVPVGGTLTATWTLFNGPGTVTFADPTALNTTATFSNPGTYTLRLKVSDGQLTGYDDTTVQVARPCRPAPDGLVGWWAGDGSTDDLTGSNPGVPPASGITYAAGEVDQAFQFDGTNGILIPANPGLDVGAGAGFTVEGWINPVDTGAYGTLVEWGSASSYGVHFWIYGGPGSLLCNLVDTGGGFHYFYTHANTVLPNQYQHVALTYDKTSGVASIYCNGALVQAQQLGVFTPQTSLDLHLGYRAINGGVSYQYRGAMDEISLYNRTLGADEIQAIYAQAVSGKCKAVTVNHAPAVTAGPNLSAALSDVVTLAGSATDDGLPLGGTLSVAWTKVSGPGNVLFANPAAPDDGGVHGTRRVRAAAERQRHTPFFQCADHRDGRHRR